MLSDLIFPDPLIQSTSAIPITYLRVLLILDYISGKIINIRRLNILLENFVYKTRISCILRSSLLMGPLFNRTWVNILTLFTKISGNPQIPKKCLKMSIYQWIFPLGQFNSQSPLLWIKIISSFTKLVRTRNMVDIHMLSQLQHVTSVAKRDLQKGIKNTIEMVLIGIHMRCQQEIFQNGSPRSLLFHMWNIWQHLPWNTTKISINVVFLAITAMVHGVLAGRLATRSGNKRKARRSLFGFRILQPME